MTRYDVFERRFEVCERTKFFLESLGREVRRLRRDFDFAESVLTFRDLITFSFIADVLPVQIDPEARFG
jgi:hypothetical protein